MNGKSFALNLASMHEIREVICKKGTQKNPAFLHKNDSNNVCSVKKDTKPRSTVLGIFFYGTDVSCYAIDSYFVYVLKMEFVSKTKSDCEKWSRIFLKSLCAKTFPDNIFYFIERRIFPQNCKFSNMNDLL